MPVDDPSSAIRAQLVSREDRFLDSLHRGIFANPASPYRILLQRAGAAEHDVAALVRERGIEATLRSLYEAGVYITLDELKGRRPIVRPGLELPVRADSFDNPLSKGQLQGVTGGSRTHGTRVLLDLEDLDDEAAAGILWLQANHAFDLPQVYWRPAAPALGALKWVLIWARLGQPVLRWYSQTRPGPQPPAGLRGAVIHSATCLLTAAVGRPTPYPRYLPLNRPAPIAHYLARHSQRRVRLVVDTIVSSAVRLCLAATELGLDISGHIFRTFAEPLTPAKAAVIHQAGCDLFSAYGMEDAGRLGDSCGTPNALDDVHLLTHRNAFLQIPRQLPGWPQPAGAIYLTSLRPTAPKVLLNVETGDYGIMSERQCGCPLGAAGLTTHLHTIRNYEKLTSAGMHFMGADLLELLEVALPQRYGGAPTDYQFIETEQEARTIIKLVISPQVGELDADAVRRFVLGQLRRRAAGGRLMTDVWRADGALQIERGQPYATGSAKIQSLHVVSSRIQPEREQAP